MRFDLHIHHRQTDTTGKDLLQRLNAAGCDGGVVLSQSPVPLWEDRIRTPKERIDNVLRYVEGCDNGSSLWLWQQNSSLHRVFYVFLCLQISLFVQRYQSYWIRPHPHDLIVT